MPSGAGQHVPGPDRGRFITIEGGDGAGKTMQAELLEEHLRACGHDVVRVHEPGGTEAGERIRGVLLDASTGEMDPLAELLLFEAARAQLVAEVVEPALAAGKVVLCDRFTDSTIAYQGYGRGLGADVVARLNAVATRGTVPDRTVLLQVDPDEGLRRAHGRDGSAAGDRMEAAGAAFHRAVCEGFDALAQADPARVRRVDAAMGPGDVHAAVVASVSDLFDPALPVPDAFAGEASR